ncbi:MAG: hypothetical protein ABIM77_02970 [candidate division WOR-3 bacterium]
MRILKNLFLTFLILSCKSYISEINGIKINKKEFEIEKKIQKVYNLNYKDEEILLLLIQKKLKIFLLEKDMNFKIEEKFLKMEKQRIDRETKAPWLLEKIKKIFNDERDYLEYFVKGILASRIIENIFYYDTIKYQKEKYYLAKNYLRKIKNDKKGDFSKDSLYFYVDLTQKEEVPPPPPSFFHLGDSIYLKNMEKFEVYPEIIEAKHRYFIVRKIGKKKFDGFIINKKDFTKWFNERIEKISIKIKDKELKNNLLKRIKGTFWENIIK